MYIPSLPTDNLYKFMALSGVIIFIMINYLIISTGYKQFTDVDAINLELNLLMHDTTTLNMSEENFDDTRYIITQYVSQKYKDQIPFIHKRDSILSLNMIYFLALQNAELIPAYEKVESLYYEAKKQSYEFERNRIRINSLIDTMRSKKNQYWFLIIVLGFFDIIGIILTSKGFSLWYSRVQIYQDEALKKSSIKDI